MTPLLDRRGAESDERSESARRGGRFILSAMLSAILIVYLLLSSSTTPARIRLHLRCSRLRATPPVQEGSCLILLEWHRAVGTLPVQVHQPL